MKGWYKESHRHYLAAKGIKTNRYSASKYSDYNRRKIMKTSLGYFDDSTNKVFVAKELPKKYRDEVELHENVHKDVYNKLHNNKKYKKLKEDVHEESKNFAWAVAKDVAEKENRKMTKKEFTTEYGVGKDLLDPEEDLAYIGETNKAAKERLRDIKILSEKKEPYWVAINKKRAEFLKRFKPMVRN